MPEPTFNQYAPPVAEVADVATSMQPGELKLFSATGRIGRLRYLAYGTGAGVIHNVLSVALLPAFAASMTFAVVLQLVLYVAVLWFGVITGIKRCHDMGISGWWTLTLIIPLIVLAWLFVPGDKSANRFGAPPPPNSTGVKVLGALMPVIMVIGILAAIAIPQYKAYTDKARAAQAASPH